MVAAKKNEKSVASYNRPAMRENEPVYYSSVNWKRKLALPA